MRPTRLLLSLVFFSLTIIVTYYSLWISHGPDDTTSSSDNKKDYNSFFSWHMPSTLFPQSAIISLTDDNSTFFLSRPANYGPRLPIDGLSGQLWIGSGFSDDAVLRGGPSTKAEGELGCSDIPGWDPNQMAVASSHGESASPNLNDKDRANAASSPQGQSQAQKPAVQHPAEVKSSPRPDEDDGTDDYLHWPLKDTSLVRSGRSPKNLRQGRTEHADIQSLQETAEIAGKVVLLSRGGCGFLEKSKWVQRRGGVALIVGDNIRGGPLTTMYANGDASNISIPSVFTTRTTAHLLSSLIPGKNVEGAEDPAKSEQTNTKLSQVSKEPAKAKVAPEKAQTPASNPTPKNANVKRNSGTTPLQKRSAAAKVEPKQGKGWFSSVFSGIGWRRNSANGLGADSSRPPSSGQLNWVVSQDWDEDVGSTKQQAQKDSKAKVKGAPEAQKSPPADTFVIGVQDWRDPDMMSHDTSRVEKSPNPLQQPKDSDKAISKDQKNENGLSGGSHTPGSGVYHQSDKPASQDRLKAKIEVDETSEREGWFGRLFGGSSDDNSEAAAAKAKAVYDKTVHSQYVKEKEFEEFAGKPPVEHEGLWVTLTPTTISTTPFFDTLLVLVVSPLVTLTVVYALLLLRSRIRRRRWRAPKSVVDRLPVRTYHTMSFSSTSTSSQTTSPEASSPTSPLLRTQSRTMMSRSRPRSRTTSMLAEEVSTSLDKATARASLAKGERKRIHPKKYNGRQIECVVCLEEYIDGQSRVMSLPCGHEFHAECITPWLTTRRRTCPICKGDVVRSMASASNSSSTTDVSSMRQYLDPDEVQVEAAQTRNESPSAAIPIPQGSDNADLERGDDLAATLVNDGSAASSTWNWRELASRSLSVVRGEPSRRAQEDRSR